MLFEINELPWELIPPKGPSVIAYAAPYVGASTLKDCAIFIPHTSLSLPRVGFLIGAILMYAFMKCKSGNVSTGTRGESQKDNLTNAPPSGDLATGNGVEISRAQYAPPQSSISTAASKQNIDSKNGLSRDISNSATISWSSSLLPYNPLRKAGYTELPTTSGPDPKSSIVHKV